MKQLPSGSEGAKLNWVPLEFARYYEQLGEHSAWYSGDADQLIGFYATRKSVSSINGRFWAENTVQNNRNIVHTPIAGDIATFSADLLFSEPPTIKIREAHETNSQGNIITNSRAVAAEDRLHEIIEYGNVINRMLTAGETAAGLGGVFLKPTWDREVSDHPILSIAQPDNALPYFRYGMLAGVVFHKIVMIDNGKYYRLLEHYGTGAIETGLFVGDERMLGSRLPLTYMTETARETEYLPTQIPRLLCKYVANKSPHKRFRGSDLGMSDLQGIETYMDALDMTMTSWMRDIAIGRGRLHVPSDVIELDGNGGASFDMAKEIYINMDIEPGDMGETPITATQFEIRAAEHEATATKLITTILHMAGYAPHSFGFGTGSNVSEETSELRERKTLITKQKKERFFKDPLADVLQMMMQIDAVHLGRSTPTEFRPSVAFANTLGHDIGRVANTVQMLKAAQAASVETRVRMVNPDLTEDQIKQETERIRSEEGLNMNDPLVIGGKEY